MKQERKRIKEGNKQQEKIKHRTGAIGIRNNQTALKAVSETGHSVTFFHQKKKEKKTLAKEKQWGPRRVIEQGR